MDNNATKEFESKGLNIKNLERLRESILDFETQTLINNDDKFLNKQQVVTPDFVVLINTLNVIKNISLEENLPDIVKLSDASCVFLNYINNSKLIYRDEKILDIIKYIIYSFKSLFLNQKREDFEAFVHHLNNPLETFTIK